MLKLHELLSENHPVVVKYSTTTGGRGSCVFASMLSFDPTISGSVGWYQLGYQLDVSIHEWIIMTCAPARLLVNYTGNC
jgi:hypothetical protein